MGRMITLFYETEEEETKELPVDLDLLEEQKRVAATVARGDVVLPEVRAAMIGVLHLLEAISDLAPSLPGRENSEYPDDDLCPTCMRWFRRNELLPAGVNKRYIIPVGKQLRGKCPACEVDIFS